jgi:pimeloyl-ACP methyl ester carboxylesterase
LRNKEHPLSIGENVTPRPAAGWAEINGLDVRYLDWGGDGPPVMALHGLASSGHWYDLVAPHLRERHRVIVPDQRGHGQTTQAKGGYDGATLAADIVGLMDYLGVGRAAVLGHSWGASVATFVAAHAPERVSALVLIDGGVGRRQTRPNETWAERRPHVRPRDVSGTRQQFLDRLRNQLHFCWNAEVERIVQTMVYEDEWGQIQDILRPENHLQVMRSMFEEPSSSVWHRVECPTLLVPAGPTPDRANSENARNKAERVVAAQRGIANSRVHWIPETVHDIGYHKPLELAQVIREFLAGA